MLSKSPQERYLNLLKKSLIGELYVENEARIFYLGCHAAFPGNVSQARLLEEFLHIEESDFFRQFENTKINGSVMIMNNFDATEFIPGRAFSYTAHSMIGRARMDNLHNCMDQIIADDICGDFIETGVWKGGSTIFMRGFLAAHGIAERRVWVADSFAGLPKPTLEVDLGWDLSSEIMPYLAISEERVRRLFERYELLDKQVMFLKGWFCDTLPEAPIEQLALLRLDGDLYESTMDALKALYHKVSPGGFVIVDDYNALPQCAQAIHDFRNAECIEDPLIPIDQCAVYWRKRGAIHSQR